MAASFTLFGLLPPELRCKIWRDALPSRHVACRLMDANNHNAASSRSASSETSSSSSWWAHYLVTRDCGPSCRCQNSRSPKKTSTSAPSETTELSHLLVSHEARAEALRIYKHLTVNDAVLRQFIGDDEALQDERRNPATTNTTRTVGRPANPDSPRINIDADVLEWADVQRWTSGSGPNSPQCGPLFLAASLSVRHVVVDYDAALHAPLAALAFAVLDVESGLQSLTIRVRDPDQETTTRGGGDGRLEFRLARLPARPVVLQGGEKVRDVLKRHKACFLQHYRPARGEVESLDRATAEAVCGENIANTNINTTQNNTNTNNDTANANTDTTDTTNTSPSTSNTFRWPLSPSAQLDTAFAIYQVLPANTPLGATGPEGEKFRRILHNWETARARGKFNRSLRGDVALLFKRLALLAERAGDVGLGNGAGGAAGTGVAGAAAGTGGGRSLRPCFVMPYHGFCLPGYGLP